MVDDEGRSPGEGGPASADPRPDPFAEAAAEPRADLPAEPAAEPPAWTTAESPEAQGSAPEPDLPPVPPSLPPPPVYWAPPPGLAPGTASSTGWVMPADAGTALDIGRVLGRTFDTYGREWPRFLLLALPVGLAYAMQPLLTQSLRTVDLGQVAVTMAASVALSLLSLLATVAIAIATDRLWRGERPGIPAIYRAAVNPSIRLLALGVLIVAAATLAAVAVVVVFLVLAQVGPVGAVLLVIGAMVGFVALAVAGIRLYLVFAVVALERLGPLDALRRAWTLSRGQAIRLFALGLALAFAGALPIYGALLFSLTPDPRVTAIAYAIAGVVATPLTGISYALAWNDLTGAGYADSEVMARGRGRRTGATLVFGVGIVLLAAGFAVAGSRLGELGDVGRLLPNRGAILFGHARGSDPCAPGDPDTTFTSTEAIYVGGYFERGVPRGRQVIVTIRRDGETLASEPLTSDALTPMRCYYERDPITGAMPGVYEFAVEFEGDTIARGVLTVTP